MTSNILVDKIKYNVSLLDKKAASVISQLEESKLVADDKARREIGPTATDSIDDIRRLFAEVYTLSDPLRDTAAKRKQLTTLDMSKNASNKAIKFDKDCIDKITRVLHSFNEGSIYSTKIQSSNISEEYLTELKNIERLEKLIFVYLSLIYITVFSQITLDYTLPLSDDITYYEDILASKKSMIIYMLQTLPIHAFHMLKKIYDETLVKNIKSGAETAESISIPEWVPDNFRSTYKTFGKWVKLLFHSSVNTVSALATAPPLFLLKQGHYFKNSNKSIVSFSWNSILGLPFYYTTREIVVKRDNLLNLRNSNVTRLGMLLKDMPICDTKIKGGKPSLISSSAEIDTDLDAFVSFFNKLTSYLHNSSSDDSEVSTNSFLSSNFKDLVTAFDYNKNQIKELLIEPRSQNVPPGTVTKYWIPISLVVLYGPTFVNDLFNNREKIYQWISLNLVETTIGFWNNWIVKPVNNILSIVRHDNNSRIAIMSQKSLGSDLESLERMVLEYTLDNYSYIEGTPLTAAERTQLTEVIRAGVKQGDMTTVMKGYEHDMKKPIKNILTGDMIRNLLIQVQKTKVDGALAMSGIDKILKSQELVFGIVAASPSCLILYWLIKSIQSYIRTGYIVKFSNSKKLAVAQSLNNIERLLTYSLGETQEQESHYYEGLLFLETISLRNNGLTLVPSSRMSEWIRDVNDLGNNSFSNEQKIYTVRRISNNYQVL